MSKESKRRAQRHKQARQRKQERSAALGITPAHAGFDQMHEQFKADRAKTSARPVHRPMNAMSEAPESAHSSHALPHPAFGEPTCSHGKRRDKCPICDREGFRSNNGDWQSD